MFVVIEIQTAESVSTIVNAYENRNDAENKYHSVLSFASISEVPIHSAVMLTDDGKFVKSESYDHRG
jgi:hypothetical protein